jgi:maleate isomerase
VEPHVTKNYNPKRGAHRVGVIIPSVNATTEPDFAWAGPAGISFHAMRVMLHETTPDGLRAMNTELDGAAHRIASVTPDVVAYACTAGTFLEGKAALTQQIERIAKIVECPVVATSKAMIEALRALGIRRLALATPYLDSVNEAEVRFLAEHGFEVCAVRGLGLSGKAIREVPPDEVFSFVRGSDTDDAEAIFVSCTDFRAMEVIDALERELGKPVLTSNQVTLWDVLRALGRSTHVPNFGKLLAA